MRAAEPGAGAKTRLRGGVGRGELRRVRRGGAKLDQQKSRVRFWTRLFDLRDRYLVVASSDLRGLGLSATTAQHAETGNQTADACQRGRFRNSGGDDHANLGLVSTVAIGASSDSKVNCLTGGE